MKKEKKNQPSQFTVTTDSLLIEDLKGAKRNIDTILNHLNYCTEPDLIDSYTYELKAAYLRYKYLLQQLQQEEVSA